MELAGVSSGSNATKSSVDFFLKGGVALADAQATQT